MLEGLTPPARTKPCKVQLVSETLDMNDRTILWEAIDDQLRWKPQMLAQALAQRGLDISRYHIEKHRAGTCPC